MTSERAQREAEARQWMLDLLDKPLDPQPATTEEIAYFIDLTK